jgi:hypothetical protein
MEAFFITATLALIMNVPLGLWRANTRRLSLQWFIALHMAVPPIIALRVALDVAFIYVPALIAAAIMGQVVGNRLGRRIGHKAVEYSLRR